MSYRGKHKQAKARPGRCGQMCLGIAAGLLVSSCVWARPVTPPTPQATVEPIKTATPTVSLTPKPTPSPTFTPISLATSSPSPKPDDTSTPLPTGEASEEPVACTWEVMAVPTVIPPKNYPWVTEFIQEEDGALWIATSGGVFVAPNPDSEPSDVNWVQTGHDEPFTLGGGFVLDLTIGPDGMLWAGTLDDGDIHYYDHYRWRVVQYKPGQPQETTLAALAFAPDDSLWLGYGVVDSRAKGTAIASWALDGAWTRYTPAQVLGENEEASFVQAMEYDRSGRLWVVGDGVRRFDGRKWYDFHLPDSDWVFDLLITYTSNEAGQAIERVWIANQPGVQVYEAGRWRTLEAPDVLENPIALSLASDALGRVWVGWRGAISLYSPSGELLAVYTVKDGLPVGPVKTPSFWAVYVDRDGTLWAAHYLTHVARCRAASAH